MKKIKQKLQDVKDCLENLKSQGVCININIEDIENSLNKPKEYVTKPSDYAYDSLFMIDDVGRDILQLYGEVDKLRDLLRDKDL